MAGCVGKYDTYVLISDNKNEFVFISHPFFE